MLSPRIYLLRVRDSVETIRGQQPAHSPAITILTDLIDEIDVELQEVADNEPDVPPTPMLDLGKDAFDTALLLTRVHMGVC